jgi:SET domain-containing protein
VNSISELLEVKFISPKKGRGVFAKRIIKKNTVVELANVVLISNNDYDLIQDTILYHYIFEWDAPKNKGEKTNAIAFGVCQFFNHSYTPNLKYTYDYENFTIEFLAIKNILKGEELTVNYNGKVKDNAPVWFDVE